MREVVVDDYIVSVSNSNFGAEITDEEYSRITEAIENKPTKDGYCFKLRNESLIWEMFEVVAISETEATETDYINALEDLGGEFQWIKTH